MRKFVLFFSFILIFIGSACSQLPHAGIVVFSNVRLCPGTCTNFLNASTNATSYQWVFPGATPSTSTAVDPQNICYNMPGNYDVMLIAYNSFGSDTVYLSNYITVYPYPPPQGLQLIGDTLIANPGAASYQWYLNGTLIPGATDYFYVGHVSGEYSLIATDTNGCEVETNTFGIVYLGMEESQLQDPNSFSKTTGIEVFPNPVYASFEIRGVAVNSVKEISIYNLSGEMVLAVPFPTANWKTVDSRLFPKGIYHLEVVSGENTFRTKFLKQ